MALMVLLVLFHLDFLFLLLFQKVLVDLKAH